MTGSQTGDTPAMALTRIQSRRLREVYRSAGWPSLDSLEIELLATGMLERIQHSGHDKVRLTDAGVAALAQALHQNRQALSAHDALVGRVAQMLLRDGRVVWTGLSVRARLPSAQPDQAPSERPQGHHFAASVPPTGSKKAWGGPAFSSEHTEGFDLLPAEPNPSPARWKTCKPDVFSIRNTSVAAYLEPVVHEIKVSRADLMGDLRLPDKRDGYLDLGSQCWYVLGCDAKGRPIAQDHEVPLSCGVIIEATDGRLEVVRHAPRRVMPDLPFSLWMALARATALPAALAGVSGDEPSQAQLVDQQMRAP